MVMGLSLCLGDNQTKTWQELPLPQDIIDNQPKIEGDTERNWQYLSQRICKRY